MEQTEATTPANGIKRAVTIHDVANALGMHKSTVSLALSGKGNVSLKTRAKVTEVANAMGYQPNPLAQRLAKGATNSLVCLCSGGLDVGLTTEKILLIQKELGKMALEVPIYTFAEWSSDSSQSQAAQVRNLCRQHPRAIVCAAQALNPVVFEELAQYQAKGGIVVSYDSETPLACDQVIFDREDNVYRGAQYLIEHGHTKLGLGISFPSRWPAKNVTRQQNLRVLGFKRALKEAGLPFKEEWLYQNPTYEIGGAEMARHFLETKDRPTGLCIVNDYVTLAFMVEMANHGIRVPEDVSIVGHDNQPVAAYCPVPLTSVSQPAEEIALAVVDLLAERLAGSTAPPRKVILRGELIERKSVARPA
jgi:DNA-binding LacI/PurR family transcriptional regulator